MTNSTTQSEKPSTKKTRPSNKPDQNQLLEILTQLFHDVEVSGFGLDVAVDEEKNNVTVTIHNVKFIKGILVPAADQE